MIIKEGKPIFFRVLLIVITVLLMNIGFLIYRAQKLSGNSMTGFSVKGGVFMVSSTLTENYTNMSISLKIFLIFQWTIIIFILAYAIIRDSKLRKEKGKKVEFLINKNLYNNKTDLDTLYDILKQKKELTMSAISKTFDVTKDTAVSWCKILESGDIVCLDYPGFGEPSVRLLEKSPIEIINNSNFQKDSPKQELKKNNDDIKEIKKEIEKNQIVDDKDIKNNHEVKNKK